MAACSPLFLMMAIEGWLGRPGDSGRPHNLHNLRKKIAWCHRAKCARGAAARGRFPVPGSEEFRS